MASSASASASESKTGAASAEQLVEVPVHAPKGLNPQTYDQGIRKALIGYDGMMACAAVALDVAHASKVLVVGSGSGQELITFSQTARAAPLAERPFSVVGVDPASVMVDIANARAREALTPEQLACVSNRHGFVSSLPLDDVSCSGFDAAACVLVAHALKDDDSAIGKRALLLSITARLRPGAKFFMVDHHGDTSSAAYRAMVDLWITYMINGGIPAEAAEHIRKQGYTAEAMTAERTSSLLSSVGLVEVVPIYQSFMTRGIVATYRPSEQQAAEARAAAQATAKVQAERSAHSTASHATGTSSAATAAAATPPV